MQISRSAGADWPTNKGDVFGRLLDRVDPHLVDSAVTVLAARPGVRAVRRVRMRWVGHQLEADAELDVARR